MKNHELTPRQRRQRQLLLFAPLLVLPPLTLFFWALGGGRSNRALAGIIAMRHLNATLPEPKLKEPSGRDKMSYYDQAAKDSDRLKQERREDPYTRSREVTDTGMLLSALDAEPTVKSKMQPPAVAEEAQVYQKLAELKTAIQTPQKTTVQPTRDQPIVRLPRNPNNEKTADPELRQMNGLLEKILDIQHPERLKAQSESRQAADTLAFRAFPAAIDGNQKITQGSVVRMKLLDSVNLKGIHLPKGQIVFASGNLYNQRMMLSIRTIRIGYLILPVNLTVYDMTDGMEGINIPGMTVNEAMREGAGNGVQSFQLMSLDQSLSAQAATAGINAARGLFAKKVRPVKVKLKNGHPLLLRINR